MHRGLEQPMPSPHVIPVTQPPAPFAVGGDGRLAAAVPQQTTQYYQQHHQQQPQHHGSQQPQMPAMRLSQDGSVVPERVSRKSVQQQQQPQPQPQQQHQQQQQQRQQPPSQPNKLDVSKQRLDNLSDIISTASPELRKLVASHNSIRAVPRLSYFRNLKSVVLSHNKISEIGPGAFHGMTSLEILDLQANLLTGLPSDALVGCDHLRVLNLRGNKFTRAPNLSKCSVLELLLDGNRVESLATFPDDVGIDAWGNLRRIGLGGNQLEHWGTLKHLAGLENLESIDLRRNPMLEGLPFNHRLLLTWVCPLLTQIDDAAITDAEFHKASLLFSDGNGSITDTVLMLDDPTQHSQLEAYLQRVIPLAGEGLAVAGGERGGVAGGVQSEQFTAMRNKVKEMSQIVKVLHRSHVNRRRQAATLIQSWYRGVMARIRQVPVSNRMRFKQLSVYGRRHGVGGERQVDHHPHPQHDTPFHLPYTALQRTQEERRQLVEAVVAKSRKDEMRLRASFKWHSNPNRLHVSRGVPVRSAGGLSYVLCLQRHVRGFLVRNRVRQIRDRHCAALTIQCMWRGYLVRQERRSNPAAFKRGIVLREVDRVVTQRFEALRSQNELLQNALKVLWNESRSAQIYIRAVRTKAASRIQAVYRGHVARCHYRSIQSSLLRCYAEQGVPSRQELLARIPMACVTIQSVWRGFRARRRAEALRERRRDKEEISSLQAQVRALMDVVQDLGQRHDALEKRFERNVSRAVCSEMEQGSERERLSRIRQEVEDEGARQQEQRDQLAEETRLQARRREAIEQQEQAQREREAQLAQRQTAMDQRAQQIARLGEDLRALQDQQRQRTAARPAATPSRTEASSPARTQEPPSEGNGSPPHSGGSPFSDYRASGGPPYAGSPQGMLEGVVEPVADNEGFVVRDVRDVRDPLARVDQLQQQRQRQMQQMQQRFHGGGVNLFTQMDVEDDADDDYMEEEEPRGQHNTSGLAGGVGHELEEDSPSESVGGGAAAAGYDDGDVELSPPGGCGAAESEGGGEDYQEYEPASRATVPRSGLHFIGGSIGGATHLSMSSYGQSTEGQVGASGATSFASIRTAFRAHMGSEWARSSDILPLSQRGTASAGITSDAVRGARDVMGSAVHFGAAGGGSGIGSASNNPSSSVAHKPLGGRERDEEVQGQDSEVDRYGGVGARPSHHSSHHDPHALHAPADEDEYGQSGESDSGSLQADDDEGSQYSESRMAQYRFNDLVAPPGRPPPSPPTESLL